MKKIHYIFLTTFVFIALFYHETIGLNLGFFSLFLTVAMIFKTPLKKKKYPFWICLLGTVISSLSFMWYGDFPSFAAMVLSQGLFIYYSKNNRMNILFSLPVFIINGFTFLCRLFNFERWIPKTKTKKIGQKVVSLFIIPLLIITVFITVYSNASTHFSHFFSLMDWDFDFLTFSFLLILGFIISFNYWDFTIEKWFYKNNHYLNSDFRSQPAFVLTFKVLDLDAERRSGVVSLFLLNILTLLFVIIFSYEMFFENSQKVNQLSQETHERVNTVILSIIMAISLILFYFKSVFNFDKKAKILKTLALSWMFINTLLIVSTLLKNSQYVHNYGLTYKRLGVYAFLIMSLLGLVFAMLKILKKKTNFYLITSMNWSTYILIILISVVNWGGLITRYNISHGFKDFDYLKTLNYNHQLLKENFPIEERMYINYELESYKNRTFLSKVLYYETLNNN